MSWPDCGGELLGTVRIMRPVHVETKAKGVGKKVKSGVPVLSSPAGGRAVAGSPGVRGSVVECCGCGTVVTDEVCALQCDECLAPDAWKCADCLGLDNAAYSALAGCKELEWRCDKCRKGSPKTPSLEARIADRLGEVLTAIGGVLDRLLSVEDRLRGKTEESRTITLENGVRVLEEKVLAVERLAESLKNVEKLESRVSALERGSASGGNRGGEKAVGRVGMGELGMMDGKAEMVTGRGEVDKWEMAERLKRRTSVIVHDCARCGKVEEKDKCDCAWCGGI